MTKIFDEFLLTNFFDEFLLTIFFHEFTIFYFFFRPAAEGQEANGNESFNGNGDHHAPSDDIKKAAVAEQENLLQQKYLAISQEY